MKYVLVLSYCLRFHSRDLNPFCNIIFNGTFLSDALPRVGENIAIPFSIHPGQLPYLVPVLSVTHIGRKGFSRCYIECRVNQEVNCCNPTILFKRKLKDLIFLILIPAARDFGLVVTDGPRYRENNYGHYSGSGRDVFS